MPKGGKMDRCHDHVKEALVKQGVPEKEADGKAWGVCKKTVHEGNVEKDTDKKKG